MPTPACGATFRPTGVPLATTGLPVIHSGGKIWRCLAAGVRMLRCCAEYSRGCPGRSTMAEQVAPPAKSRLTVRRLGWAGIELGLDGATVVIEPLENAAAVFEGLADARMPELAAPIPGDAAVGLLTHLHRDHADAGALARALAPGAPV